MPQSMAREDPFGSGRDSDRLPDSSDPSGPCPRCGRPSNFTLRGRAPVTYRTDVYLAAPVEGDRRIADQQLVVMECAYCEQNIVVIEEELHDGERGKKSGKVSWRGLHWWPPPSGGTLGPDVPQTISQAFDEAFGASRPMRLTVLPRCSVPRSPTSWKTKAHSKRGLSEISKTRSHRWQGWWTGIIAG